MKRRRFLGEVGQAGGLVMSGKALLFRVQLDILFLLLLHEIGKNVPKVFFLLSPGLFMRLKALLKVDVSLKFDRLVWERGELVFLSLLVHEVEFFRDKALPLLLFDFLWGELLIQRGTPNLKFVFASKIHSL